MLYVVHNCQYALGKVDFSIFPRKLAGIKMAGYIRNLSSPPLYSLLPLWAGDTKEGQLLCPEFDGKSSCPIKGKYLLPIF